MKKHRSVLALLIAFLVLASALLSGVTPAYAHAIEAGYRFYSYGDASLLLPQPAK